MHNAKRICMHEETNQNTNQLNICLNINTTLYACAYHLMTETSVSDLHVVLM